MSSMKRVALYVRVSTDAQTVGNQIRELRQVAKRRGWDVVEVYSDAGISGAKGRNGRPGLDSMLKDASRRKFDIIIAWAIDRLGRSLIDLLDTIQHLEACGVDLYLDQQAIDTTTPMLHRPTREWLGLLIPALGLKQEGEVVVAECNGGMILAENPLVDLDSPTKERLGLLILALVLKQEGEVVVANRRNGGLAYLKCSLWSMCCASLTAINRG